MRIHTDTLTASDVYAAVRDLQGVNAEVTTHRSRSHITGLEVKLTGNSTRRPNSGTYGGTRGAADEYAATWDEWGIVLHRLFDRDPEMVVGTPKSPVYDGAYDFRVKTGWRYDTLKHADQHRMHRWAVAGSSVRAQHCRDCDAVRSF